MKTRIRLQIPINIKLCLNTEPILFLHRERKEWWVNCLSLGEAGEGEGELGLYAGSLLQKLKTKNNINWVMDAEKKQYGHRGEFD